MRGTYCNGIRSRYIFGISCQNIETDGFDPHRLSDPGLKLSANPDNSITNRKCPALWATYFSKHDYLEHQVESSQQLFKLHHQLFHLFPGFPFGHDCFEPAYQFASTL